MTTRTLSEPPADLAALPWRRWWRQVRGIAGLEVRRQLRQRRALAVAFLGLAPVLLMGIKAALWIIFPEQMGFPEDTGLASIQGEEVLFADLYEGLILRLCIFFGCVAVFVRLFRGDMLSRTLHHYFLQPVRREILVVGKYVGGVVVAALVFGASTLVSRLLMYAPYDPQAALAHFLSPNGLGHLLTYLAITVLACVGYGAVFVAVGLRFRNPIIPVLFLLAWESANIFLPSMLKPFSLIWYLTSLIPVNVDRGPLAIVAAPAPLAVAIPGVLIIAAAMLVWGARVARRMEIEYGED